MQLKPYLVKVLIFKIALILGAARISSAACRTFYDFETIITGYANEHRFDFIHFDMSEKT